MSEQCNHSAHNWNVVYQCRNCNEIVSEEIAEGHLAKLEAEIAEGDYWMERHTDMVENGGCPVCFRDDESIGTHGHFPGCELAKLEAENEALKNNLLVIQNTNDELRDTVKSLRQLAYEYIQAYESLAFEDAKETT